MSRLTTLRLFVATAVLAVFAGGISYGSQKSAANMAKNAAAFLGSLSADQRAKAVFPFESEDRLRWHFIPNEMFPRKGLMIKDMNETQRRLAHDLLRSGLSAKGYTKVTSIIELEDILRVVEAGGRFARNKEEYLFSVFGTPAAKGRWGWRVEGHHISVRFAVVDGAVSGDVSSSPMFLGTNPAEVQDGAKKGLRILAEEEDAARALLMSLPVDLQKQAIASAVAPTDILTMNKNDIAPLPDQGVAYSAMPAKQQALLVRLIEVYSGNMEADLAAARMARIKAAGLDKIRFAWLGEIEKGKKHYYSVQGPTFLIEYDNTQNNGNHIHSVWRDFNGDFGRDVLRDHLKGVAH
ncbi:MAG TPA: DUF3500 domain-containing protein [Vicinamibacterales bacterium]|nr:DUF3500 domain-containing protein [Vicinamibacterales bacterium]